MLLSWPSIEQLSLEVREENPLVHQATGLREKDFGVYACLGARTARAWLGRLGCILKVLQGSSGSRLLPANGHLSTPSTYVTYAVGKKR